MNGVLEFVKFSILSGLVSATTYIVSDENLWSFIEILYKDREEERNSDNNVQEGYEPVVLTIENEEQKPEQEEHLEASSETTEDTSPQTPPVTSPTPIQDPVVLAPTPPKPKRCYVTTKDLWGIETILYQKHGWFLGRRYAYRYRSTFHVVVSVSENCMVSLRWNNLSGAGKWKEIGWDYVTSFYTVRHKYEGKYYYSNEDMEVALKKTVTPSVRED